MQSVCRGFLQGIMTQPSFTQGFTIDLWSPPAPAKAPGCKEKCLYCIQATRPGIDARPVTRSAMGRGLSPRRSTLDSPLSDAGPACREKKEKKKQLQDDELQVKGELQDRNFNGSCEGGFPDLMRRLNRRNGCLPRQA